MTKRLVIANDHGGLSLKEELLASLAEREIEIINLGTDTDDSVDYPDLAHELCKTILENRADLGLLICGSGIGMSMAANRHKGIRAALCTDPYMAKMTRAHNDANVLCLGGRFTGPALATEILFTFLDGEFEGDRHIRRLKKIELS